MIDLRKEQLALLRVEKQIAGLATLVAASVSAAEAADGKLHARDATEALANVQASLLNLAQVTAQAHDVINVKAVEMGATLLQAAGLPKNKLDAAVLSILGLG